MQAYASLGAGALGLLDHPAVAEVANRQEPPVTPGQVLLRWGLQSGAALLPKSCKPERMVLNRAVWGFKLSEGDMEELNKLEQGLPDQNTMAGWLREHDPDHY